MAQHGWATGQSFDILSKQQANGRLSTQPHLLRIYSGLARHVGHILDDLIQGVSTPSVVVVWGANKRPGGGTVSVGFRISVSDAVGMRVSLFTHEDVYVEGELAGYSTIHKVINGATEESLQALIFFYEDEDEGEDEDEDDDENENGFVDLSHVIASLTILAGLAETFCGSPDLRLARVQPHVLIHGGGMPTADHSIRLNGGEPRTRRRRLNGDLIQGVSTPSVVVVVWGANRGPGGGTVSLGFRISVSDAVGMRVSLFTHENVYVEGELAGYSTFHRIVDGETEESLQALAFFYEDKDKDDDDDEDVIASLTSLAGARLAETFCGSPDLRLARVQSHVLIHGGAMPTADHSIQLNGGEPRTRRQRLNGGEPHTRRLNGGEPRTRRRRL